MLGSSWLPGTRSTHWICTRTTLTLVQKAANQTRVLQSEKTNATRLPGTGGVGALAGLRTRHQVPTNSAVTMACHHYWLASGPTGHTKRGGAGRQTAVSWRTHETRIMVSKALAATASRYTCTPMQ